MSDINNIFKEALKGHEAPFDASMWDKVSTQLSPMEDAFRNSVDNHEVPYNPQVWSSIKGQIGSSSIIQWIAGSAAALGLIAGAIAFIPSNNEKEIENVSRTNVENNAPIVFTENKPLLKEVEQLQETNNTGDLPTDNATGIDLTDNSDQRIRQEAAEGLIVDNSTENGDFNENNDPQTDATSQLVNTDNGNTETDNLSDVTTVVYNADFSCSTYETCAGNSILFNPKVVKKGLVYSWNFGDGTASDRGATSHVYTTASNYEVTLTVKDERTNTVLASSSESISVNGIPNAEFTTSSDYEGIPTIDIISSDETESKIWKINDKVVSDRNQFEYTFREKGDYKIELLARNEAGCENSSVEIVTIDEVYNLLAPDAISLNGNAMNNHFMPAALTIGNQEFLMTIYDQAGNLIYNTNNTNTPWVGQNSNDNSIVPGGVYVWGVELKNGNGTYDYYKGTVLVLK